MFCLYTSGTNKHVKTFSDVHPTEPVIQPTKIFRKSVFQPPKNSLQSIKSEKDIQNLTVKELKVLYNIICYNEFTD